MVNKNRKRHSKQEALMKLERYCAYQDRCHSEVRNKLLSIGVYGDMLEEIIVHLVQENFLNEERFARSYARGKFRIKSWGRIKIVNQLRKRSISEYCIKKGLSEIDEEEYYTVIKKVLEKRNEKLDPGLTKFERGQLLTKYGIKRGFEYPLIKEVLDIT